MKDNTVESLWEIRITPTLSPRYNIKPTQEITVICNDAPDELRLARWGLIPPWEKEFATKLTTINARDDKLAESRLFSPALKQRRCLIPASGFFEWQAFPGSKKKRPRYIHPVDGQLWAFAGLWSDWMDHGTGEVRRSCTIITTSANEVVAPIHDRMPAILPKEARGLWMAPEKKEPQELLPLLRPYPADRIEVVPVGDFVSQGYDGPECLQRESQLL